MTFFSLGYSLISNPGAFMAVSWSHLRLKPLTYGLLTAAALLVFLLTFRGFLPFTSSPTTKIASPPTISPPPLTLDANNDGFPDTAQLWNPEDRARFRRWFCALAEVQYYRLSPAWEPSQRDCAGLLRYAYKEALRKHDLTWRKTADLKGLDPLPDVTAFNYPQIPLLGEKLFRIRPGPLNPSSLPFAAFADAQALKNFNLTYLGKDRARAEEGDILIFFRPENPEMPYHLMVYLKTSFFDRQGRGEWLIYHTGPTLRPTKSPGEMRRVSWQDIEGHPDPAWHPVNSNPNFLGFYRWKLLKG